MNNYAAMVIATILGQLVSTAIMVYIIQKKKDIPYWPAMGAYLKAEQGGYIIAMLMLAIIMFLFAEQIQPSQSGLTHRAWVAKMQVAENLRLYTLIYGVFSPLIALVLFKKGLNAIKKEDDKLSVG